jgi:GBP family porin
MQNQLRLLTAAIMAIPAVAYADASSVILSGTVNVEYTAIKIDQGAAGGGSLLNNRYQTAIGDPTFFSRWGLNIKEDLGNGLNAIAKIEYAFAPGAGVLDVAREQWVGLSSKNWGTIQFGSVNAPFKVFAGGASVDRFIGTSLHLRGSGGAQYAPFSGFGTAAFVDHAVTYISPVWSGVSFATVIAPSNATQADATLANTIQRNGNTGGKGNGVDYQVAVKYALSSFGDVFGGYSRDNANDNQRAVVINGKNGDDETVWRLGANLKFGNFGVYGQYDRINNALNAFTLPVTATTAGNGAAGCAGGAVGGSGGDAGSSTQQCNAGLNVNGDGNIWSLGTSYTIGKTMLVVQGGKTHADSVGTAIERTATNITVGAIYNLSKRTRVHVGYQNVEIEGARTVSQIGTTSGQAGAALAIQPDRSTFSMGMRHTF